MGYTHYWNYKEPKTIDAPNSIKALKEMKKMLLHLPSRCTTAGGHYENESIIIKDGVGKGSPVLSVPEILFNGDASKGLDHETFAIQLGSRIDFDFCKTARKPYDFFVCVCLISLANNLDGFEFSSDGGFDDWKPAIDFYNDMFGDSISDNLKKVILQNFEKDLVSK
jgi:hypothetical protein